MKDLTDMRLVITDYTNDLELADAIARYHALMQISFSTTTIYKIFETESAQVMKFNSPTVTPPPMQGLPIPLPIGMQGNAAGMAVFDLNCKCGRSTKIQANLNQAQALQPGNQSFPSTERFKCPNCGTEHVLTDVKRQIEAQTKGRVVT
jgi:hypothetical protein